jgi:predicted HAD superfamily phosphohydrolase YqeG
LVIGKETQISQLIVELKENGFNLQIENNLKEARISTLQKIVELGFGGRLELNIKF